MRKQNKNGKKWQLVKENMKNIRKLKCNGHTFRRKNFIRNLEFVFLLFFHSRWHWNQQNDLKNYGWTFCMTCNIWILKAEITILFVLCVLNIFKRETMRKWYDLLCTAMQIQKKWGKRRKKHFDSFEKKDSSLAVFTCIQKLKFSFCWID